VLAAPGIVPAFASSRSVVSAARPVSKRRTRSKTSRRCLLFSDGMPLRISTKRGAAAMQHYRFLRRAIAYFTQNQTHLS
jgi:hypothetical protein